MARYIRRPSAAKRRAGPGYDDDDPLLPYLDVPDHEPSFTGLVDVNGEEIWRAPRPIGFGRDKEW